MKSLVMIFVMIASGIIFVFNSSVWAQDSDPGKSEFQSSCAACHGLDGEGKGPLSTQLKVPPADLTVLTKKNNGVFPFEAVYEVIDGRREVAAHGTRDMPIWGSRYGPNVAQTVLVPGFDPETMIRMRILVVMDYLNRIQKK
jgi:mono/diheme cytochrome c family protein